MTNRIDGNTPLWIAARELLHERVADFINRTGRVLDNFAPDDIHDLRVSSRRLREGLALFEPCYPPQSVRALVKKVRRVTRMLGDIRNTDEAILFFSAACEQMEEPLRDGLEKLLAQFRDIRKKVIKKLRKNLPEMVPPALHDHFRHVINAPLLFGQAPQGVDLLAPLSGFAVKALDQRFSQILKLLPDSREENRSESQHLLRIAVKHYRYRLEILYFLVGDNYEEVHSALKGYQDVLGRMHDMDVFDGIVRGADLPASVKEHVCYSIKKKREKIFSDFSIMLENMPLESMGTDFGST